MKGISRPLNKIPKADKFSQIKRGGMAKLVDISQQPVVDDQDITLRPKLRVRGVGTLRKI